MITSRSIPLKVKKLVKKTLKKLKLINNPVNFGSHNELNDNLRPAERHTLQVIPTKKNTQIIGSNWLIDFKANQYSEHGEDGIIAKIFEILAPENKWVCEFGAHDPEIISNTWRLVHENGWNAVLIEADNNCYEKLKAYYQNSDKVHCVKSMVSYEGSDVLDNVLKDTPVPANLDFMVIDIDGNDYHVWKAIEVYQAKVVMIEFNAAIPTDINFVQARNLSVNQGSSLAAMVELGKSKGYQLIAVTAWNAFFVKKDYFHLFFSEEPALDSMYVYPAKNPIWMRAFQLYDGTIAIAHWDEMLWHKIKLTPNDYQVLPASYRVFSRELASRDYILEKDLTKTPVVKENEALIGRIAQMPGNVLSQFAKNNFSRYGEDGILEKLINATGLENLTFVEVGAGDGLTFSRSRNLSSVHRWRGLLLENDESQLKTLKKNTLELNVTIHSQEYALKGNNTLDEIFKQYQFTKEFGVLILNVYGMEYYLWESLLEFSPSIVAVQFNPTVPNDVKFIQENNFSVHQGCSLSALVDLAHYKDYELVAVTLETAFFVKRKFSYRLFEKLGIKYNDLDGMFAPALMQLFQLYDGSTVLQGLNRLMWSAMRINEEKLQFVPSCLRKFHQFTDEENKKFFYRV